MKKMLIFLVILSSLAFLTNVAPAQQNTEWFSKTTHAMPDGRMIDRITIKGPPEPPAGYVRPVWKPGTQGQTRSSLLIACVPAFNWSFGCSATSAAMMAGYYDITGRTNMYAGPTNGGVMPLDNSAWPDVVLDGTRHQCPLSATRNGLDGRSTNGHVDDYWISYGSPGPDPWVTNGWTEHTHGDCTGDYMWTNQWVWTGSGPLNTDGSTTFWYYTDGAKTHWNELTGHPYDYDGGAGLRDFFISRGYTVSDEYNQYTVEEGNTYGFSFNDYKSEIDNGRPVIIQVEGHTMLGFGYNTSGNVVHLHDTWDYNDHTMTWAGSYSGMHHYGVTVIHLAAVSFTNLTVKNTTVGIGKTIAFSASNNIYGSTTSTSDFLTIDGNGSNGGNCTMTAGNQIYLREEFHAKQGCEFLAQIASSSSPEQDTPNEIARTDTPMTDLQNITGNDTQVMPFSILLYPNPCKGNFIVMITGELQDLISLEVTDIMGNGIYRQEVFTKKLFLVDIRTYPRGIYVVRAIYKDGMFSEKIVYQ
jgi:hypothetical protein